MKADDLNWRADEDVADGSNAAGTRKQSDQKEYHKEKEDDMNISITID